MDFQSLAGNMVQHYVLFKCFTQKVVRDHQFPPNFSSFANLHSLSLARPTKKIQIAVTDSVSVVNFRVVRGELSIETDAASIAHPPELELCRTWNAEVAEKRSSRIPTSAGIVVCPTRLVFACHFLHHVAIFLWFPCYSFDIKTVDYLTGIGYPIPKDAVYQYIILVYQ